MQMRENEKVGKSRNSAFFQWFVAPEGRTVGSLKRRVRSQLTRWKIARRYGAKHISKSKCTKHRSFGALLEVALSKKCTFPSQNVQSTPCSDHFWKLRCLKSARCCGAKHISKSKCTKHQGFGPLLDVQMSFRVAGARDCAPCQKWAKREGFVVFSTTATTTPHYTPIHYTSLHYNYNYTFTTFHYTTLHSTTLHYTQLHSITLNYTQLHYTTLHYTTLHYIPLHYNYNYNYNCNCNCNYTLRYTNCITLHYTTLHYTTHYATLHYATLPYTTLIALHYTTLPYSTLHYITLHYTTPITPPQMQLQLHYTNYITPPLQLHQTTTTTTAALHHATSSSCGWGDRTGDHCNHCSHSKKTQLQPPFGPWVGSLCHPWFTTTNLSYRFPIFETSATDLCGTTGITIYLWSNINQHNQHQPA